MDFTYMTNKNNLLLFSLQLYSLQRMYFLHSITVSIINNMNRSVIKYLLNLFIFYLIRFEAIK